MINRLLISLALISMFHLCMNEMIFCSSSLTPGKKGLQSQTVSKYPCKSDVCLNVFHAVFLLQSKMLVSIHKNEKKKKNNNASKCEFIDQKKIIGGRKSFLQWHQSTKTLYIGTSGLVDRL